VDVGSEGGHSSVERLLPAAENEDESAFFDEPLCRGEADAGSAAGDYGGLSTQSVHFMGSFVGVARKVEKCRMALYDVDH
jgi:hypothetical protein